MAYSLIRLLLIFGAWALSSSTIAQTEKLFTPLAETALPIESKKAITAITTKNKSLKFGTFKLNPSVLQSQKFLLDLPDGRSIPMDRTIYKQNTTHLAYAASSSGNHVVITLVTSGNKVSGTINTLTATYSVDSIDSDGNYLISALNPTTLPKNTHEEERPKPPAILEQREKEYQEERKRRNDSEKLSGTTTEQQSQTAALNAAPIQIDAMVQYTASARAYVGTDAGVISTIRNAVNQANITFAHSNINIQLNLVDVQPTTFNESGLNMTQTLENYTPRSEVGLRRNQVEADVVILFAYPQGACGQSYLGPKSNLAYSAVNIVCAIYGFTFTHEFGHLLGADHNIGAPQQPPDPAGSAHGWPGNTESIVRTHNGTNYDVCWRTVMAETRYINGCNGQNNNEIVSYWSSTTTSVPFNLGPADTANWYLGSASARNDLQLNTAALTVSQFRGPMGGGSGGGGSNGGTETNFVEKVFNWIHQLISN